jgi:hypothetical protein
VTTHSLYFDAATGASGDMILAAMLDAGAPLDVLNDGLSQLSIPGVRAEVCERKVASVATKGVAIIQPEGQPLRRLADLLGLMGNADLPEVAANKAKEALTTLARAEAKVHGASIDEVHFHEIGAVDTVADILGACLLWDALGRPRTRSSPVNVGSGFVNIAHGRLPVPAPAVAELAKDAVPIFSTNLGREAATPTGIAVLRMLCDDFGPLPPCRIKAIGYGSGDRSSAEFPTYVRAFLLEPAFGQSL